MKIYIMGGSGNGKWGGYIDAPISEPNEGTNAEYDGEGIPKKSEIEKAIEKALGGSKEIKSQPEKTDREKRIEQWRKEHSQTPEAIAERERNRAFKSLSTQGKIEYLANTKMLDKYIHQEYKKWSKKTGKNHDNHHQEWVLKKLPTLKKDWAKGDKQKWMKTHAQQAEKIRDKIRREQEYKEKRKRLF